MDELLATYVAADILKHRSVPDAMCRRSERARIKHIHMMVKTALEVKRKTETAMGNFRSDGGGMMYIAGAEEFMPTSFILPYSTMIRKQVPGKTQRYGRWTPAVASPFVRPRPGVPHGFGHTGRASTVGLGARHTLLRCGTQEIREEIEKFLMLREDERPPKAELPAVDRRLERRSRAYEPARAYARTKRVPLVLKRTTGGFRW
eukprot:evm.model.scf_508.3 EVM.evm.TU.scf_508.3   scf_508:46481-47566(-)